MNTVTLISGLGLVGLTIAAVQAFGAESVTEERSWTETFAVTSSPPDIQVSNVWGNVSVTAGPPGEITLLVHERRTAPTQSLFDLSREIMALEISADVAGVAISVGDTERNWRRFDRCRGCRVDYQLELSVPADSTIDVSTVTDGRIQVRDVTGPVTASNVNGPIDGTGVHECIALESVNGAMSVTFADAPTQDCKLETINGDITLGLPDGAGIDVAINLFNGRIVSDIDVDPLTLPARVEETEEDGRYRYRIEQPAGVRLQGGGPTFSFSSLNGDIRIKSNP